MAGTEAVVGAQQAVPQGAPQTEENFFQRWGGTIFRMVVMYWLVQSFQGNKNKQETTNEVVKETDGETTQQQVKITPITPANGIVKPAWKFGQSIYFKIVINEEETIQSTKDENSLYTFQTDPFVFTAEEFKFNYNHQIELSNNTQHNGTIYAHLYLAKEGFSINEEDSNYSPEAVLYRKKVLTRYFPIKKQAKMKRLIGNNKEEEEEEAEEVIIADDSTKETKTNFKSLLLKNTGPVYAHWHNNFTIQLVNSDTPLQSRGLPPPVLEHIRYIHEADKEIQDSIYPIVYFNDFWVLRENCYPVNQTLSTLPINVEISNIALWKFQMIAAADAQLSMQMQMMGGDPHEMDLIKSTLMDTNPWLLGLTMIVSLLHSLFDFLAFKNDIAFWQNKKDNIGVSVRTLTMNIIFQLIIFLYLFDNSDSTSWMVLISNFVSLLIEAWKIKKALNVKFIKTNTGFLPYTLEFQSKETTELEEKTDEYDQMAYTYLSYIAYPLLVGYAIYSLYYETHKSWYSYFVNTAVGFVYAFGFITMTPQLFINYKLKSVAHMPFKTFMYKALNTFIDDLFAFIIKMPTLHRLACLRDDVVFFVYLYQRWIYKEDHTRANEFGQVALDENETKDKKEEAKSIESKKEK
ncbi:cleft lip and palate transmembrane 1 [Neoconidiobolus thromboides FSU 785]|nr:cleft lip and palate transmembrane 1 [Neoconidiobolus thromboides FSU 785]